MSLPSDAVPLLFSEPCAQGGLVNPFHRGGIRQGGRRAVQRLSRGGRERNRGDSLRSHDRKGLIVGRIDGHVDRAGRQGAGRVQH